MSDTEGREPPAATDDGDAATDEGGEEEHEGLERHPHPGQMPSDSDVQAERQEEGLEGEFQHE